MRLWEMIDHSAGTYVMMQLSEASAAKLAGWCDDRGIVHDPATDFHCSLCYSRAPVPAAEAIAGPVNITAEVLNWEHLGTTATVLLLKCTRAEQIHQLLRGHGASHDWEKYTAHLTVNSQQHVALPDSVPDVDLVFDNIVVTPLQPSSSISSASRNK